MAEDNKENLDSTIPEVDITPSSETPDSEPTQVSGDDWKWDASVQTNIGDDLTVENITAMKEEVESATEKNEENERTIEEKDECNECIVCGKSLYGSSSELYCTECCAKFLKTQYGVGHIVLAFVMVIVAAFGYFIAVSTGTVSAKIFSAQSSYNDKCYDDVVTKCQEASDAVDTVNAGVDTILGAINENLSTFELFTDGTRSTNLVLNAMAETLSISYSERTTFTEAVDAAFTEAQLAKPKNAKIKACYDFCKTMDSVSDKVSEEWQNYIYGSTDSSTDEDYEIPYDDTIEYLDSVETASDAEKSVIEYYKFMTAYYAEKDKDTILKFYDNSYNYAGDFSYMFLPSYLGVAWEEEDYDKVLELADIAIARNANDTTSYYYAVKTYINKENYDKANELCEKMKEANPDGLDYYSIKAEVLRREGKYQDAVDICKKGIAEGSDAEIYRQEAIALMLLDQNDEALEAAKESYNITLQNAYSGSSVSLEALNTTALIAKLCGDDTTYQEIVDLFTEQSMTLEDSVQKCIKGDITFEQIFTEGTGEV